MSVLVLPSFSRVWAKVCKPLGDDWAVALSAGSMSALNLAVDMLLVQLLFLSGNLGSTRHCLILDRLLNPGETILVEERLDIGSLSAHEQCLRGCFLRYTFLAMIDACVAAGVCPAAKLA